MFSVIITEKGGAQRRLDFDKNEVTIGRVQGNDIILPKGNVSKRHSRIVLKDARFIVVDLKSTNGTYVNGRKITSPLVVKAGDKIYIGDFILTLDEGGAGAQPSDGQPMGQASNQAPSTTAQPPLNALNGPSYGPPPMGGPTMGPPPIGQGPSTIGAPGPMGTMGAPGGPMGTMGAPGGPMGTMGAPGGPMGTMGAPGGPGLNDGPPPMAPMGAPSNAPPMGPSSGPPDGGYAPPQPPGMGSPSLGPPSMGGPALAPALGAMPPPAPSASSSPGALASPVSAAPAVALGDRRSAPPRLPRSESAGSGPPPLPREVERFPLDEEPGGGFDAPSPRVRSAAPRAEDEVSRRRRERSSRPTVRRVPVAKVRDPQNPIGHILATISDSLDVAGVSPPELLPSSRWKEARALIDSAIGRLEADGGLVGDRDRLVTSALHEALGMGPLTALLDDSDVDEIVIEGPNRILVSRGAGLAHERGVAFSSLDQLTTIAMRLLGRGGVVADTSVCDATFADGTFISVVLPPAASGGAFVQIRRSGRPGITGEALVQQGALSTEMLRTLRAAVRARKNVVLVGPSSRLMSQMVSIVATLSEPTERLVVVEATPALALGEQPAVRLSAGYSATFAELLDVAVHAPGDRLVIDGIYGDEARAALLALAARGEGGTLGIRGLAGTNTLEYLNALCELGAPGSSIRSLIAAAVDVTVRVGRTENGEDRVLSVSEVLAADGSASEELIHAGDSEFISTDYTPTFER